MESFMKYQITRILTDRKKAAMLAILLLLPSIEVFQILYDSLANKLELPYPLYATFLSLYSRGHVFQSLYLWFMPLYLLVIIGEDSVEDYSTGYKNVLMCRIGRSAYIKNKLKSGFLMPFATIVCGLLLNLILIQIVCQGGTHLKFDGEYMVYDAGTMPGTMLFKWSYTHPLLANLGYIFITALFCGMIGMAGVMFVIVLHDRKIVYALTFALWFFPVLLKNSFMLIFQPFSEYGLLTLLPLGMWILGLYVLILILLLVWEVKFVEI